MARAGQHGSRRRKDQVLTANGIGIRIQNRQRSFDTALTAAGTYEVSGARGHAQAAVADDIEYDIDRLIDAD